jgi:hypothetical protein
MLFLSNDYKTDPDFAYIPPAHRKNTVSFPLPPKKCLWQKGDSGGWLA